jgi:hypothetical protein
MRRAKLVGRIAPSARQATSAGVEVCSWHNPDLLWVSNWAAIRLEVDLIRV